MNRARTKGGKSNYLSSHVRIHLWELKTVAYRSLSVGARALLVELRALCNGTNNGNLHLSVREAGKRLGVSKDTAARYFAELLDRGFIRESEKGFFSMKSASRRGQATSWVLTEQPHGTALPTKDFVYWQPEIQVTVSNPYHAVRVPRTPLPESHAKRLAIETDTERIAA